jgi:hypothetical protein
VEFLKKEISRSQLQIKGEGAEELNEGQKEEQEKEVTN